ncbi:COG4705 family protein [Nocardia acidivorans]|uniref:COG4705 family protein n=1 Tax=Nocardia acidivorans TaxID=404580 RepID=UPI000831AD35|nr:hypothetical protein [Nocardia acidivorans]
MDASTPGTGVYVGERQGRAREYAASKVPQITVLFWVIKILTTGMGEATSDWALNQGAGLPGLGLIGTMVLDIAIFVGALVLQFRVPRYLPAVYWLAVTAVAIFGTAAADIVMYVIGLPMWLTCAIYALLAAATFTFWYRSEKTLSIHSITTRRRETFYWLTVFWTFALGTALGDLTAAAWDWGYLLSGVAFAALIAVPWLAHRFAGMNGILAFWFGYVVTRPLGASFADWFARPADSGGLDLGAGWVALIAAVAIAGLVTQQTIADARVGSEGSSRTDD